MDEWQRDEFEKRKQLEAERDKLTDAQRQQHDSFCAFHHEQKTLTPELAIKVARIIRTERGVHQMRGLDDLDSQANAAAEDKQRKAFAADDAPKELRAQEAAERKAEEARAAEQRQAQEQAKQLAATETAQREPLPKSVTQFDAHLDRTAKTERDATTRATDAAKAINRGAYQSRREDFTRYDGLTALHAANTPARIPAASHAFGALDLQSRQRRSRSWSARKATRLSRPCRSLKSNMSRSGTPQTTAVRHSNRRRRRAHPTTPCARSPP